MKKKKLKPWTKLSEKVVYKNPWFRVFHEKFVTPALAVGNYFIIHTNETDRSVFIVPIKDDKIIFTYQYRYAIKKWALELPGGGQEKGCTPLVAAKKEFEEELGYTSKSWKKLGVYSPWSGPCAEQCTVFLADALTKTKQNLEETEKGLKIKEIPITEAYRMLDDGKISDCQTIAALSFARKHLLIKNKKS
ncbi:MAG: NUDIX hydrolase [Parcubacteria group bacterium]|jgi:ADP-ribose pyrophosphatase